MLVFFTQGDYAKDIFQYALLEAELQPQPEELTELLTSMPE
jgi:hypothetical protein